MLTNPLKGDSTLQKLYLFYLFIRILTSLSTHYIGHITTCSFMGRGSHYIQLVKVLYCTKTSNYQLSNLRSDRDFNSNLRVGRKQHSLKSKRTLLLQWYQIRLFLSHCWTSQQHLILLTTTYFLTPTLSPPTSEVRVRFLASPQVGKLVVACCWLAVYSTEP